MSRAGEVSSSVPCFPSLGNRKVTARLLRVRVQSSLTTACRPYYAVKRSVIFAER
jgi:hypothetical protein